MEFNFKYKEKHFSIDVEKCENYFSRAIGLMFRKKSKSLLFVFIKQTKQPIHSFFCKPFIAIWFYDRKIIDIKFVKPWQISVFPLGKFDRLLEIPVNNNDFDSVKFLIQK